MNNLHSAKACVTLQCYKDDLGGDELVAAIPLTVIKMYHRSTGHSTVVHTQASTFTNLQQGQSEDGKVGL